MESKGAEVTATKAASVMSYGELDLCNSRDTAVLFINGVVISHKGKGINAVQLLALKRRHGGILDQQLAVVFLDYGATVDGVLIFILYAEGFRILSVIGLKLVVIEASGNLIMYLVLGAAEIDRSANVVYLFNGNALVKETGDAEKYIFSHTVGQYISAAVNENGAAN